MKSSKMLVWIFLGLAAAVAAVILISRPQSDKNTQLLKIRNFEDCQKAGYPIMQSYPRQCTLPNGKFFIEQIVPGK